MSFSLSGGAPLRIAAIVGGFVLLGAGYFVLGPGKPKPATTEHHFVRHPNGLQSFAQKGATTKQAKPVAKTATKSSAKTQAAAKHEAAPAAKPKTATTAAPAATAKPKPKPKRVTLVPDLPYELAAALQKYPIVVVTIYNPNANDDQIAVAEANAGAALAGVGFVGLSVLDEDQVGPVTRAIGLVDSPASLVYQRPGQVISKLHGFADRETVAQAVATAAPNAVSAPSPKAPAAVHASAPSKTSAPASGLDPGEVISRAIPAIEKYNADHNGYVGMTVAKLREYDPKLGNIVIVKAPTAVSYCVRSTAGKKSWYKRGPSGKITTTPCTGP